MGASSILVASVLSLLGAGRKFVLRSSLVGVWLVCHCESVVPLLCEGRLVRGAEGWDQGETKAILADSGLIVPDRREWGGLPQDFVEWRNDCWAR